MERKADARMAGVSDLFVNNVMYCQSIAWLADEHIN